MIPTLLLPLCLAVLPAAGRLHPSVACQASSGHTYALYLPSTYREDRLWPVVFVFSPAGDGAGAASLFQAGAERLGWIVIASNDARNGPRGPIHAAQAALWREAFERTKADPKRVYAAGFSGGARMAMALAEDHCGACQGVISIGAFGTGPTLGPGHLAHVLLCGEEDFNHAEQAKAWERLRRSGGRVLWMEHFPGGHEWAPASLIEEAMGFLDLASGQRGFQPRDTAAEAAFLQRRLEAARALPWVADRVQATRRWEDAAALPGAPAEAQEQAQRAAKDPDARKALSLERSFAERSFALRSRGGYGSRLVSLLGVAAGSGPEALDARRLLERERVDVEQRCREALLAREWEKVLPLARGQVAMGDRGARGGVYLAMALGGLGRKEEAMTELQAAFRRGYRPSRPLGELPLLAPLRGEPGFRALEAVPR